MKIDLTTIEIDHLTDLLYTSIKEREKIHKIYGTGESIIKLHKITYNKLRAAENKSLMPL